MSKVKIQGNASGTGVLTIEAPNTNTDSTITLPDGTGTLLTEVADNAITLAKMASGTDGNIISYDASGNPVAIATGTDGQVLTSTGAGSPPAFEDAAGGGATEIDGLSDGTTTGTANIGLGANALNSLTTGSDNTALGYDALTANTEGLDNVAVGRDALKVNTTGSNNVAVGDRALYSNTLSSNSTAIGDWALYNQTDANFNTAVGKSALRFVVGGEGNTAVGYNALTMTTGYHNTAIGNVVLDSLTTGNWNIGIGYNAEASAATASSECTIGSTDISNLRCNDTSISSLSDQRDKAEITDLPEEAGLSLINSLRPVTYFWDRREWYDDGIPDGSKIKRDYRTWKTNSGLRQGFIAQEVESAISGHKYLEDSQVVNGTADKKEFAPQHLLTNAIKAIQQLSAEVETLKAKVSTLEGV